MGAQGRQGVARVVPVRQKKLSGKAWPVPSRDIWVTEAMSTFFYPLRARSCAEAS